MARVTEFEGLLVLVIVLPGSACAAIMLVVVLVVVLVGPFSPAGKGSRVHLLRPHE